MKIERSRGDTSPLRITWNQKGSSEAPRLDDVTAIEMRVYDDDVRTTTIETLTGYTTNFDPATWFNIIDAAWDGTRHFEIFLTRASGVKPLPMGEWVQA